MDGAPKLMMARPRHVEANGHLPFGLKKHSTHASAIDDHPVLLDLSRNALKHGRAKVVLFGIFVSDLNHRRKSKAQHSLLGHELEIFDCDLDSLLRLSEN